MPALSILDLVRVTEDTDARGALDNARDLAAHAEALGLSPILGRRASQHARHRERRDGGRPRPYRGGHPHDPRRRRRHHAAEPCADRHRRAVRHAGAAVSRPHRPRPRARAGHRSAHRPGAAPDACRAPTIFRRTCSNCRRSSRRRGRTRASRRCRPPAPRCRCGSSDRAPTARSSPPRWACPTPSPRISRPICCCRRWTSTAAASSRRSSSRSPTRWSASTSSPPTPTRGAAAGDDAADVVHQHVSRHARPEPAADRRYRDLLVAGREGAGDADAGTFHRRIARHRACRAWRHCSPRPAPTN